MKRIISIAIVVIMALSVFSGVAVFADNEVESTVKHVSRDSVELNAGGKRYCMLPEGKIGNVVYTDLGNVYEAIKAYSATEIKFRGWVGTVSEIKEFGYSVNGGEIVWNAGFIASTEEAVINAATGAGATHATRYEVLVPVVEGVANVKIYVKTAATIEVIWKASYVNAKTDIYYIVSGMSVRTQPTTASERLFVIEKGCSFECLRKIPKAEADGSYDYFEIVINNWNYDKSIAYIADVAGNYSTAPAVGESLPEGAFHLWVTSEMNIRNNTATYDKIGSAPVGTKLTVLEIIPAATFGKDNYDYYKIVWPDAADGVAYCAKIDGNYASFGAHPATTPYFVTDTLNIRTSATTKISNKTGGAYQKGNIIQVVERIAKETSGEDYDFLKVYTGDAANGGYLYVAVVDGAVTDVDPRGADAVIANTPAVEDPETGDFGIIALAFAAVSSIVVKKKKEN